MSGIPRGFANMYQLLEITPTVAYTTTNTRSIIDFEVATPNYLRTQTAFFKFTLKVNWTDYYYSTGSVQRALVLDGLTTNLIRNIKYYSNNNPVEEIDEHHRIVQLMHDLQQNAEDAEGQQDFGLNFQPRKDGTKDHFLGFDLQGASYLPNNTFSYDVTTNSYLSHQVLTYKKLDACIIPTNGIIQMGANFNKLLDSCVDPYSAYVPRGIPLTESIVTPLNGVNLKGLLGEQYTGSYARCVPYDQAYVTFQQSVGCQGPYSDILNFTQGTPGVQGFKGGTNIQSTVKGTGSNTIRSAVADVFYPDNVTKYIPKCWQMGYQLPYSQSLQSKNQYQVFSPFPNIHMARGQILVRPVARQQFTIRVPLVSCFFGQTSLGQPGQLLPGPLLGKMRIRIELNPDAFFVSGLSQDSLVNIDPINIQFAKKWEFSDIRLVFDSYVFDYDPRSLNPIQFNGYSWVLPHIFQYPDTQSLNGERLVNYSYPNTLMQLVRFNLDDYKKYSYCSQHFPISGNLTSFQVKLGPTLIPALPLTGHTGNPVEGQEDPYDNSIAVLSHNRMFIDELARNLGTFFNMERINQVDAIAFALNDRVYDPGYHGTTLALTNYNDDNVACNQDKSYGKTLYYETQKGNAMYITRFDNINNPSLDMNSTRLGIDTGAFRPFSIVMNSDQLYYNPRPVSMFVFAYIGVSITLDAQSGVRIEGFR